MDETDLNHNRAAEAVVEVDIATAGRRIAAYLLNTLFGLAACIPFAGIFLPLMSGTDNPGPEKLAQIDWNMPLLAAGILSILVYCIVQVWMMSSRGQSIGKRIMKIRVLKTDGTNPGFWGTVMVREVLFNIVVTLASMIVGYLVVLAARGSAQTAEIITNVLGQLPLLICFVMLFNRSKNRRTLQDMMAGTVVVRLPAE